MVEVGTINSMPNLHRIHHRKLGEHKKSWICFLEEKIGLILLVLLVLLFLVHFSPQKPIFEAFKFSKPKPVVQSETQLPENIQDAILNLAKKQINQEQANANLPFSITNGSQTGGNLLESAVLNVRQLVATNPSDKAKIKIRKIDLLIGELQNSKDTTKTVKIIQEIGRVTDEISRDPNVQTDRSVLQLQIEQYNRLQLILQILEDQVLLQNYLKIEEARQKYLVVTAINSINAAPSLEAIHNIVVKEIEKIVGKDFAELKAIEVITDFEVGVKPEARTKLTGLEKQLAIDFEKRMLNLPPDIRKKKLEAFIKYSFGNPATQIKAFDQMKGSLTNKELVAGVDSLSKLAVNKLEDRVFELKSPEERKQFLATVLTDPKDKNFLQIQSDINKGKKASVALSKEEEQKLYEKIQAITQTIFLTNNQKSDLERSLPDDIQVEIDNFKKQIPNRNVPKLVTPKGVILPEVAKLSDSVENAILTAAKQKIAQGKQTKEVKLDLTLTAKDLKVEQPLVLPDNPLYFVKELIRKITLVVTLDPIQRAENLISQDNQKTLEAVQLIQNSQDIKTIDLALETLNQIQDDFNKLKEKSEELQKLKQTEPQKVDQLVDQIIENGVARQTAISAIEDKVAGDKFVEIEKIRQDILQDGVDTLLKLTDNNVESLTKKLEAAVENQSGSDLKDIKAVELLTEIKKTQPEEVDQVLDHSIENIIQKLEDELLSLPADQRVDKVLEYVSSEPGNPVIQFEAAAELKDHFSSPETIALAEDIKDKAVENLIELVSEITDGASKQQFADIVVGSKPADLAIIVDIELRVTPPETKVVIETTPILEEVREIKTEVIENIIEEFKDKPLELAKETNESSDIVDVKAAQELTDTLVTSKVEPAVVKAAETLEKTAVDQFIEDVSSKEATVSAKVLEPVPEVLAELVELKQEIPNKSVEINTAINTQVDLMQKHLTEVSDPAVFETYITQIQQDPIVAKTIASVGGSDFSKVVEEKTKALEIINAQEQMTLETTVKEVTQEIFQTAGTSNVEATLPTVVQTQIQEIKTEVPVEQITPVEVPSTPTVPAPISPPPAPAVEVKPPEVIVPPPPAAPAGL